ncbi:MAG: primosomal protein N' [Hydrogenophilales bacterium CG17_big_fil_post_rev_8_21_14_2_50_63_12]|nr:MAG: primosomal protein N' [Hydrogenophilales bacterium CG17_big_fil_post_rev_8_21_14_2_50_63_12]PIX95798.1 MAG: primosomal protein N' [Hydrogenophilales bacterium CG_4_10_14_3_um_filter_63_21]PJB02084.1 MAG: primosomal protein N' [Hydrogenophilales bacterium CG_4_9_14_3_um_filter_63_34]
MSPIARVALDIPLDRLFDYRAPEAEAADIGRRVEVLFGPRTLVGVLVELAAHSEVAPAALKTLLHIDRDTPPLPAELLALARFAAGYYHHPLGAVLASLLPPALRHGGRQAASAARPVAYVLSATGRAEVAKINARKPAQFALATRFLANPVARADLGDREKTLLRGWQKRGWLEAATLPPPPAKERVFPPPTADQEAALNAIRAAGTGFSPWLLYGVTGSGKTEVYLRLVAESLARGRQALILVPEIHLTPQLSERFKQRFPGRHLVGLHSGLSSGERRAGWLEALAGRADIILGTRLAVFTPLPRLGLIVVDEEHDTSYKQMEGMRYSARDVAVWRARQAGVPIVLGSATPALETWNNARAGRYQLLSLATRAHAQASLPTVRLIDSRADHPKQGLSRALLAALEATLQRGEQSLVFINRRGYAPTLLCNGCGHVFPCPRCSAHLVLHRAHGNNSAGYRLVCHHCGLNTRPPEACPECGGVDLRPSGQGTQRVEETLAERFPEARILRIDRDSAARKGAFSAMRERVAAREVDILVGTQIVAKGHDFPHLTLVGVIGADQALVSPDFRASERLFAQLMQVAGRAGRAEHPGMVLIQTRYPGHPLYQAVARHDYPGFAAAALRERRAADFPPFVAQAVLRAEANTEEAALGFLLAAREIGLEIGQGVARGVEIFDPVPALMLRIAGRHRLQLLLQSGARGRLQAFLGVWLEAVARLPARGVKWILDVDPVDV